jgi:hypothetical protein
MKHAKRKSAKKKAGRTKLGGKKVHRKKGKKGGTGVPPQVVVLDPDAPLGDDKRDLSRSTPDRILWLNLDGITHWVRFVKDKWPFNGKQKDIKVRTGRPSKTMIVRDDAPKGPYEYTVVPEVEYADPEAPPDGPAVIIGD